MGEKYWKILVIMYEGSGFDDSEEQWRRSCGASPLGISGTGIFGLIQRIICPVPMILVILEYH